jgi:UDPglucose--hexose-1-phosphate uridylyltransferase
MSELRHDRLTRSWVIVAPERGLRPDDLLRGRSSTRSSARPCPFCPGVAEDVEGEVWRVEDAQGRWRLRVLPNRYPALHGDDGPTRSRDARGFMSMPGSGHSEVIIENPAHDWDLVDGPAEAVELVLQAYRARYGVLRHRATGVVLPFRNHGPSAGASLPHPHSQVIATPVVPAPLRALIDVSRAHYDEFGTCLFADVLDTELADGSRIVAQTERVVAFMPFAASTAYETWLMPRGVLASFGDADDALITEAAGLLRRVLRGLDKLFPGLSYNYAIRSAPIGAEHSPYFVWHLRILPRLVVPAGFELGAGMTINTVPPEEAAFALRGALDSDGQA